MLGERRKWERERGKKERIRSRVIKTEFYPFFTCQYKKLSWPPVSNLILLSFLLDFLCYTTYWILFFILFNITPMCNVHWARSLGVPIVWSPYRITPIHWLMRGYQSGSWLGRAGDLRTLKWNFHFRAYGFLVLRWEEAYYTPYTGHTVRRFTYHSQSCPSGALAF